MSATTTTTNVLTACPSWCGEHWASDKAGDLGAHLATVRRERWEVDQAVHFHHDRSEAAREVRVSISGDDGLTPDEARVLAADLTRAADSLGSS